MLTPLNNMKNKYFIILYLLYFFQPSLLEVLLFKTK